MEKKDKIIDFEIEYNTNYRNIKYPRLEFRTGKLELILPLKYKNKEKLLEKHSKWIVEKNKLILRALKDSKDKKLEERNEKELRKIVLKYTKKRGIRRIFFRKMKSKWASLSSNNNLTVNILLKYLPEELIRYVIFHELTHLKQKRHNEMFWSIVSSKFKNYEIKEKDLFIYWFAIQSKKKVTDSGNNRQGILDKR